MNSGSEAITHMYGSVCDLQLCCILSRLVRTACLKTAFHHGPFKIELGRDALKISKREMSEINLETSPPSFHKCYFCLHRREISIFSCVTVLLISELLLKLV